MQYISLSEFLKHNRENDCWISLYGIVYNVTDFLKIHPGGYAIMKYAGQDCTKQFITTHSKNLNIEKKIGKYKIGFLEKY
jgi:cytochrome b involved in lipid metabolism